jgi:CDP-2,3-bis-(O-geranylgeranyl)-sn-glycerol synthase
MQVGQRLFVFFSSIPLLPLYFAIESQWYGISHVRYLKYCNCSLLQVLECYIISIESVIIPLLSGVWIMLPAYVPNPVAAAAGGGAPIDRGINFRDGKRVFGDGKTWRGFLVGVTAGISVGILQILTQAYAGWAFLPPQTVLSVCLLASGALLGDLVKSFFKRRLGKRRGESWLIADQYDLVAGAFLLVILFNFPWFVSVMTIPILIIIIVITPLLHRMANLIGYAIGVKEEPW